jgi:hypothetical protein
MGNETTYSGILGEWQRLLASMGANTTDLPHLEASRSIFVEQLNQTQALLRRQAALVSAKQQASQEIKMMISDGKRLATMLRQGIRQHYGIRSEKLAEFGIPPFRGLTGRKQPEGPPPPPPTEATAPAE